MAAAPGNMQIKINNMHTFFCNAAPSNMQIQMDNMHTCLNTLLLARC